MMFNKKQFFSVILTSLLSMTACANLNTGAQSPLFDPTLTATQRLASGAIIRSDYAPNEITTLCNAAVKKAAQSLDAIAQVKADTATVQNTLLAFETTLADFGDETNGLTFMGYVSTDENLRKEGSACEEQLGQFFVGLFTRKDLYAALQLAKATNAEEARLLSETLRSFEKNGLKLPDAELAQLKAILSEISRNETKFSANLNNDVTSLNFTAAELAGVPDSFLARAKKTTSGEFIITTKSSDYTVVMENASNAKTRNKMLTAYLNRGTLENTELLEKTVQLRAQAAQILGFDTWVDYRSSDRMAKNRKTIEEFLVGLKQKIAAKTKQDLDVLLPLKKADDPTATVINQEDISYYLNKYKKNKLSVDNELIREYFPVDTVVNGMFAVYSKLLGVTYKAVAGAKVWSPDVVLYEITDVKTKTRIGYFYADFYPRAGKYGHAAAFTLVSGREVNGQYNETVSAIVSNFTPAGPGKPALLSHDEVETLFHEFGHIMHQTLTRVRYASLSGTSTARDFVEAPSQVLENWVWDAKILNLISGHYTDPKKKLPKALLDKMLLAKNFGQGYFYSRQLTFGLFDLEIHSTKGSVRVDDVYNKYFKELIGVDPISGVHFPGTFGHMMGGYDAGYYGYLWSEVYAQDMFSVFEKKGLLNSRVGNKYRRTVLEQGSMVEAIDLLRQFLGREPNSDAFFKKIGI
jgi:thimet oligopeptidase